MRFAPLPTSLNFINKETAAGLLLMAAAAAAMIAVNVGLGPLYDAIFSTRVTVSVGSFEIAKPLLLWINDGLMVVFFFLVGLELKAELVDGHLSSREAIALPAIGAIGGMAVPAALYLMLNAGDPIAQRGWAIPAATDIAFALGVLALLGDRVPVALKIFLTSLAIFDDVGAIVIIALFYTEQLAPEALLIVGACLPVLWAFNRAEIRSKSTYGLIGLIMWVAMLKSGVHATLTGVILAMFIPLKTQSGQSPLIELKHDLHNVVAYFVLPVFAFANAGLVLGGIGLEQLLHGVPLGIATGLFVGKQFGVFVPCALVIRCGLCKMPVGMNYTTLMGTAALCGVGFTMSLFIGSLAFESAGSAKVFDERLGIVVGSLLSGVLGYKILRARLPQAVTARSGERADD